MGKVVIYLCFAFMLVRSSSPSCQFSDGSMECKGLDTFVNHTEIPENVTSVVYDLCSFKEISAPLMYKNILELKILGSGVENISDIAFAEMNALKTLDLRDNALSLLSPSAFSSLVSLQDLSLSGNRLSTLPERFFSTLPSLVRVELDDNKPFRFASEMFLNISDSLVAISCKRCDISELAPVVDALGGIVHLTELSLGGNYLPYLMPSAFSKLPQLKKLGLDNCSVKSVNDSSFSGLKQLQKLDLDHNSIMHLPSDAFYDSKSTLSIMSLNDNFLSSLDDELLQWSSVEQLHLDNNPWNCDCYLSWIHGYNKFYDFSANATCAEPESVRGSSVFSYKVSCDDGSSSIVVLAVVIPIIIICVVVISYFVFRVIQTMASRKRHAQEKGSFRYSAVYKETVEPAGGLKPKTTAGQSYHHKQALQEDA